MDIHRIDEGRRGLGDNGVPSPRTGRYFRRWRLRNYGTARVLASIPLFAECTVQELRRAATHLCPVLIGTGRVVVRRDDPANQFLVVARGEVVTDGTSSARFGPGSFFGEHSLVVGAREPATVTAVVATELLVAGCQEFHSLLEVAPSVRRKLLAARDQDPMAVARTAAPMLVGGSRPELTVLRAGSAAGRHRWHEEPETRVTASKPF